ncbi:MAG: shikimate dehydrogenase [Bacteroidota bacterium]
MNQLGLIGFPLKHSFSKSYFADKFKKEGIEGYHYENFELNNINLFPFLVQRIQNLRGLNVTIPYKEQVIPFLDTIDESAAFGAVNTILIKEGKTTGYNTDVYGFRTSLAKNLHESDKNALILGMGGASKAVAFVLKHLGIQYQFVSRSTEKGDLTYGDLSEEVLAHHQLIVNTTPLGMFPKNKTCPDINFAFINDQHLCYDLVYNPEKTLFLRDAERKGARIQNGLEMLHLQAEKAWEIWTH